MQEWVLDKPERQGEICFSFKEKADSEISSSISLTTFKGNKLGYFYVTAKSIIMEGYQKINSFGWEIVEMLAVTNKAILMELKIFVVLTLLLY